MGDGYYDYVYSCFKPQEPTPPTYIEKYKADWEKAVNRLKNKGSILFHGIQGKTKRLLCKDTV